MPKLTSAKRLSYFEKPCLLLNKTDSWDKRDQVSESHYFTQRGRDLYDQTYSFLKIDFIYFLLTKFFLLIIEHLKFVLSLAFDFSLFFFEWSMLSDLFGDQRLVTSIIWI